MKVSDFGLALTFGEGSSPKDDIQVQGTFGYVAPEYLMDGEQSIVGIYAFILAQLIVNELTMKSVALNA
jgi:hypothetical protein